jgi:general secretion pathway protein F
MGTFRYRAATATGELRSGALAAASQADALEQLRRLALTPIEAVETSGPVVTPGKAKPSAASRQAVANAIGELSVLLGAGLTLDRALIVCGENIRQPALRATFDGMHQRVKEGAHLSRAMAEEGALFPPMASAMAEAGEANGKLDVALARLAETLDRAEALRQTIVSSMVYPTMLLTVAVGVILMMLLVVVPQFEDLFSDAQAKLPFMTRMVMGASHAVKSYGLVGLAVLIVAGVGLWRWLKRPEVRLAFDRLILAVPAIGPLATQMDTARFARTLGSLVDGGVPLPTALGIARRSLANTHLAAAVAKVAAGLKEGAGLSGPLAATGLFPPMAMSFLRTGEETAQLGLMLNRLADVLDRQVRNSVQRMIAILTPAITVVMGAIVATVIASIMSAILGFNDLALAS